MSTGTGMWLRALLAVTGGFELLTVAGASPALVLGAVVAGRGLVAGPRVRGTTPG